MSSVWVQEVATIARGVTIAVTPLVLLFLGFQVFLLKLPLRQVADILKGTVIAALGLFLFLVGVGAAFLPFGRAIRAALGALDSSWMFVAIGVLLGFVTAWGEPAVRILADQKEVVLTLVTLDLVDRVLEEVVRAAELTAPGHGLAFVVTVEQVAGVVHLVQESAP